MCGIGRNYVKLKLKLVYFFYDNGKWKFIKFGIFFIGFCYKKSLFVKFFFKEVRWVWGGFYMFIYSVI